MLVSIVWRSLRWDLQCDGKCFCLCLLYLANFCSSLFFGILLVSAVPMNILVLLPSARWRIDTVTEVMLKRHSARGKESMYGCAHFSVFVCRNVGPLEFCLTSSSSSTNGFKHVQSSYCAVVSASLASIPDFVSD